MYAIVLSRIFGISLTTDLATSLVLPKRVGIGKVLAETHTCQVRVFAPDQL